jgi:allophanate hydrolase subunit 1
MTTAPSAVITRQAGQEDGKPSVTYRYAGDRGVLIEYGDMVFDLALNFFVLAAGDALAVDAPEGLVETAPGFRSMLVSYDPAVISTADLVDHLQGLHDELRPERGITISSRLVHMPVAFDDSQSRAAVERYIHSIRKDAPNAEGGTNIDYVVRYNGLRDREELYETALGTEQWTAFIGFFPGLPFMFPLDPRDAIFVPKYNPTRTWTAEGALGIGGPCYAIYPVESAGGYQLIGRTLPIYDVRARNAVFRENPLLLRAGDRVKFERVDEDELLRQFDAVHDDTYRYRIEDSPFDVGAYLEFAVSVGDEAAERTRRREEAAAATPVP